MLHGTLYVTERYQPYWKQPSIVRKVTSLFDSFLDTEELCKCGQAEGNNWIQCDLYNDWFHERCANITDTLENMANEEWLCDICLR